MSLGLVNVNLYAIDKFNVKTPEGKRKLLKEIIKCKKRMPFNIEVKNTNLQKLVVPLYYHSFYTSKPKLRVIKYKIVHAEFDENMKKITLYGFPTSIL